MNKSLTLLYSFMLVCTACQGQENSGNVCELDFSVDEISMERTLGDIEFEEPAILDAIIKENRSYLYRDTLSTPIKYIEQIILNHTPLKSTKDLQYFINLKMLIINNANLSCINLSNNINLEQLQLPGNQLSSIDLSANTKLIGLNLGDNLLTAIDLTNNSSIEQLVLNNNQLTEINLNNLENLEALNVSFNQLSRLNLKYTSHITYLNARKNQIQAISTKHLPGLERILMADNQLTEIDLSENESLTDIELPNNQLRSVKLPNIFLDGVYLSNNKIVDIVLPGELTFDSFWLYDNPLSKKTIKHLEKIGGVSIGNNDEQ